MNPTLFSSFLVVLAILNLASTKEVEKKKEKEEEEGSKICIKNGCLIGLEETSRLGRPYRSFLGIPFAKPPINGLRFKPPERPEPWDTLDANKDGKICPQSIIYRNPERDPESSEDCLYLNVYTPQVLREREAVGPFPVIVIFHPGGFQYWSGTRDYFPGGNLLERDVVVVSANYRLNILGFLSTEDEVSPGNYGLKDQRMVLQWVQENVKFFGGDPGSVTILGQDAGAVSVHFHTMSPSSKGLFHRAIAQSGSALAPWSISLPGEAREHAEYLGKYLECPRDNATVLVDCLRWKPLDDLLDSDPIFFVWQIDPLIPWKPVVEIDSEDAFLIGKPSELLGSGKFHDVPLLTGVTSHEGLFRSTAILDQDHALANWNVLAIKSYTSALNLYHLEVEELKKTIVKLWDYYFGKDTVTTKDRKQFINLFSDRHFYHPMGRSVRLELEHRKNPIFVYRIEYQTPATSFAGFFSFVPGFKSDFKGTCHGDDLVHLFPIENTFFKGANLSEVDTAMSKRVVDLWMNFILHSNPTPEGYDVKWNPVKSNGIEYLAIKGPNQLEMASEFYDERLKFWDQLNLDRDIPEDADFLIHDEL